MRKNKEYLHNQNGITLLALVVTIAILLILCGVTISLSINKDGILSKSKEIYNNQNMLVQQTTNQKNSIKDELNNLLGTSHIQGEITYNIKAWINNKAEVELNTTTGYKIEYQIGSVGNTWTEGNG